MAMAIAASRHSSSSAMPDTDVYELVWRHGALGIRFTENDRDEPVVFQVARDASPDVLESRIAEGDVVEGVQVLSSGGPMRRIATVEELIVTFQNEQRPIALRLRSRANDSPQAVVTALVEHSYTYTWREGHALGLSLAMDPCTLHTTVTSIDEQRASPELLQLKPEPGDILVNLTDEQQYVELDQLRFNKVIENIKGAKRPCHLDFVRLRHDDSTDHRARSASQAGQEAAPAPMLERPSFTVEELQRLKEETEDESAREKRCYKVVYSGEDGAFTLKDAGIELRGKPKQNGYYAVIKKIPRRRTLEGLEQAHRGDELVAIGQRDLQHVSFDEVERELERIRTPTTLVFQRVPRKTSIGAAILDGFMLLLI